MFNFFTNQKSGPDAIPAKLTTLSISWLNSHFKAVAVHHGVVEGTWEYPEDTDGLSQFETLLREAVQKTNYRGSTVTLVLRHAQLTPSLVDAPPVTGAALNKVMERQAQLQKTFPGEPAWAFEPTLSAKTAPRVMLHLFPKQLLNLLIQGCQRNGLDLTAVLPSSAVLHQQLTRLPLEKNEIAMLAGETGGFTTVVVGRGDGQLLLVRTLMGNWNENADRLALDLNRTNSFINQQYGLAVNRGVWLFGPGAKERAPVLQRQSDLAVAVSPVELQPFYWATEALKLRRSTAPNFIGLKMQQVPQRRVFAKVVATGTVLLFLASLAATAVFLRQARQEDVNIKTLHRQVDQLQTRQQALKQRNDRLANQQQVVKLVLNDRLPPVPHWFLGYLGGTVPDDLVVTNLHIKWEDNHWKLRLAGTSQPAGKPSTAGQFSNSVTALAGRLTDGPFHLTLTGDSAKGGASRIQVSWLSPTENQFALEGVMQ